MPQDQLGRPLAKLRISVTDRCGLRCRYCMPEREYEWLPRAALLDFEELRRLALVFLAEGARRIRLTGGEPLLRRDLPVLVRMLAALPGLEDLALTTNGRRLPALAAPLRAAGLQRVTISLDTLDRARFAELAQRDALPEVLAGIEAARTAGFAAVKLNCVVLRGVNDGELPDLLAFALERGLELRFIEYMDVGGATRWRPGAVVRKDEILARLEERFGRAEPLPADGAPARRYRLPGGGVFGIVASVSEPFCESCDRSRLTADGQWFHCLYAARGLDLRAPLRAGASDDELRGLLRRAWAGRRDQGARERLGLPLRGPLADAATLRDHPHLEMHKRGG